jgi:hypothetical protein
MELKQINPHGRRNQAKAQDITVPSLMASSRTSHGEPHAKLQILPSLVLMHLMDQH